MRKDAKEDLLRTKSPTVRVLVGTAVASLALLVSAGCGSGSKMNNAGAAGNAASGAPAGGAASTAPSAASGMDAGSPSAGGMADGGAPAKVTIEETKTGGADHYAFTPTTADATADQLMIVNKSDENQKVTCTGPAAASVTVNAGKTGTLKFHGDGKYSCSTNKGAKITINVA